MPDNAPRISLCTDFLTRKKKLRVYYGAPGGRATRRCLCDDDDATIDDDDATIDDDDATIDDGIG